MPFQKCPVEREVSRRTLFPVAGINPVVLAAPALEGVVLAPAHRFRQFQFSKFVESGHTLPIHDELLGGQNMYVPWSADVDAALNHRNAGLLGRHPYIDAAVIDSVQGRAFDAKLLFIQEGLATEYSGQNA